MSSNFTVENNCKKTTNASYFLNKSNKSEPDNCGIGNFHAKYQKSNSGIGTPKATTSMDATVLNQ